MPSGASAIACACIRVLRQTTKKVCTHIFWCKCECMCMYPSVEANNKTGLCTCLPVQVRVRVHASKCRGKQQKRSVHMPSGASATACACIQVLRQTTKKVCAHVFRCKCDSVCMYPSVEANNKKGLHTHFLVQVRVHVHVSKC